MLLLLDREGPHRRSIPGRAWPALRCVRATSSAAWTARSSAALLHGANESEGLQIAERLRSRVAAITMQIDGKPLQLTISIGVAPLGREDLRAAIRAADIALYRAKGLGRNQVCDTPEPPLAPATALRPA
jgi:GGDEF domain-containing protein